MLPSSRHSHVRVLLVVAVLAFVAAPHPARAGEPTMKPEARTHLDAGLSAYGAKDWPRAIIEFRAGYAIDPRPEFLFAWAQASRLSGDCGAAVELYEKFVATSPAPEQAEAARQMTARCRETLDATPKVIAPVVPEKGPEVVPPPPPPQPADERAWWKDGWGAGLATAGVVGVGVGIGFFVSAGSADDAAAHATSYDDFAQHKDLAASRRTLAAVGLGAGAALLIGSGVRYYLVHRDHAPSTDVAISLAPGGASLWIAGAF